MKTLFDRLLKPSIYKKWLKKYVYVYIRAVSVNALIYAINLAAINALKYCNAISATLFTSGVVEVVALLSWCVHTGRVEKILDASDAAVLTRVEKSVFTP